MTERRTALVTGAASGIGQLAAQRLAAGGWEVVALDVDKAGLAATAERSRAMHTRVCDVSDAGAVAEAAAEAGTIDRVIHAAGISLLDLALDQPLEDVEKVWKVDYMGTVHIVRATLPGMVERGHGELVVFSSLASFVPMRKLSAYASAKAAINAYAEALVQEYGGSGVKIRCVCPSQVDTPQYRMVAAVDPSVVAHSKGMPVGEVLDAIDRSFSRKGLYVFPGTQARVAYTLRRHTPRLFGRITARLTS